MTPDRDQDAPPPSDCPLSHGEQTRNLVLFAINKALLYLGAPVLYVGMLQAALCKRHGANVTLANLPSSLYLAMTPFPIFVAWYYCSSRVLKPVLVTAYLALALGGAFVTILLLLEAPALVIILAIVMHAALLGCALGVVTPFEWEVLGKGVSEARRGTALALAFGIGPVFALLASLNSQLVLDGRVELPVVGTSITIAPLGYPLNFALLFGATVPLMAIGAFSASQFVIPPAASEPVRPPFVEGVFGGFRDFFRSRLILFASLATILVSAGYNVLTNISLFTEEALGTTPEKYVGYQNALRFGFKMVIGVLLGWLLARTHPKAGMLATGAFCLASVLWVLLVPGMWFLLSFGLMGAGELFGVYYPNYILCCSSKADIRRNMAFARMLYLPAAAAPLLFGFIATQVGAMTGDKKLGFQVSFMVSIAFLTASLLLVLFLLPARPRPPSDP